MGFAAYETGKILATRQDRFGQETDDGLLEVVDVSFRKNNVVVRLVVYIGAFVFLLTGDEGNDGERLLVAAPFVCLR